MINCAFNFTFFIFSIEMAPINHINFDNLFFLFFYYENTLILSLIFLSCFQSKLHLPVLLIWLLKLLNILVMTLDIECFIYYYFYFEIASSIGAI